MDPHQLQNNEYYYKKYYKFVFVSYLLIVFNIICLFSVGGMSRAPKPQVTAKKVPPPAVPHEFRHSGSSFGSAGYSSSEDAVFLAPPDTPRGKHHTAALPPKFTFIFF